MNMVIDFPGGARVSARFGAFTVETDQQPQSGGGGTAPTPFETFLASLGTCAGVYVLRFCQQRGLPTERIRLVQQARINPTTQLADAISLEIQLPPDFPEHYKTAVIRAAEQCKVKKHFENPPEVEVTTVTMEVPSH
jgi:ribosomal protein S12 methylthiotransferase accessory factor